MNLSPLVMTKGNDYCWPLMPLFLKRVRAFSARHTLGGTDECAPRFEAAFGAGLNNMMLGLAIVDSDAEWGSALVGHVLCGVETYLGKSVVMVYQFAKEAGTSEDWREVNKGIQALIDSWCQSIGCREIMAMAETASRARLFRQFGYSEGPVLLRRSFHHGEVG